MAYIINVLDQSEWNVWFAGAPYVKGNSYAKVLKEWALQENAELCWNLAFFNMGTTKNIKNNCAYSTLQYVHTSKGDLGYNCSDATKEIMTLENGDACSGWKVAIKNGVVQNCLVTGLRSRNMNGLTEDGRYIHVQSTTKVSEFAMARYVNDYIPKKYGTNVKILFVQDAGGSAGCYSTSSKLLGGCPEKEGYNGRAVVTVVCAKRKYKEEITRTLKVGCKGEDVKELQRSLGGIEIDGIFGLGTRTRLIEAQKNLKIGADGIAGPVTLKALGLRS